MEKLIISCAITGAVTLPSQTPYLPLTPKQIADEAVRAAEAGAASVHIHARNPKDGKPSSNLEIYREILTEIKQRSNVIICPTTGGSLTGTQEDRIRVVPALKPELASFDIANVGLVGMRVLAEKIKNYKYEWEKPHLQYLNNYIFPNSCADLEHFAKTMKENGTKPEAEVFEIGNISTIAYLVKEGFCQPPLWIQLILGTAGTINASPDNLIHMKNTADRLLGVNNYKWSVIGIGYPAEFDLAALAITMGGHVRVGLEDNIYVGKEVLAKSNAELVEKVVRIARELGREVASPDEARQIIGLKGMDKVNY